MDIYQQVRTLVGLVANVWSWSMRTTSTFRQVMPGLVRVHPGTGSESFIMQSYYLQDVWASLLSKPQKGQMSRKSASSAPLVQDVTLKTPTKCFPQIRILLKMRWLLRLHSACCELDYKLCSLRNIILGMQYVVLQQCAEAECDDLFDTKVQQNIGAHLHLESVLDDIADQLYRALGKAHKAFLEYVSTCDPLRSVHYSQVDSPMTPPQIQPNEMLASALDTIFVANFLRQSRWEQTCTLSELFADLRAMDMEKLAQLDAVLLCAAIELGSPEVMATEAELFPPESIVNIPQNPSSSPGGAPEPKNFGSTGRKPGLGPSNAKVMFAEKPQLAPRVVEAAVHIIQHHFTFPEGIRKRLHRLIYDEYALTKDQVQALSVAAVTNIDGKRLDEDVLLNIEKKEKARLRKYFADTWKDTSHLLAPALVQAPVTVGKLAKYAESPKSEGRAPFASTFPKLAMSRSMPDFKTAKADLREPFKVPLSSGPLTYSPELKQLRSTGFFMKMSPLRGE